MPVSRYQAYSTSVIACNSHTASLSSPPLPSPLLPPSLQRLTTMNLPFTILSLAVNPSYDSYLAMCGLKECAVMCFNSSGQAVERLTLHPSVDYNGYIVKVGVVVCMCVYERVCVCVRSSVCVRMYMHCVYHCHTCSAYGCLGLGVSWP